VDLAQVVATYGPVRTGNAPVRTGDGPLSGIPGGRLPQEEILCHLANGDWWVAGWPPAEWRRLGSAADAVVWQLEYGLLAPSAALVGLVPAAAPDPSLVIEAGPADCTAEPEPERPLEPTKKYCLVPPSWIRWNEQVPVEPRLWHMLGLVLDAQGRDVPFSDLTEPVYNGRVKADKTIWNDIYALNTALVAAGFPWGVKPKNAHVMRKPQHP
jgi:hypothetical protein